MQIDPTRYVELKKKGGIELHKMGGTKGGIDGVAVVFIQKFDPNTGQTQMPDLGPLNIVEILAVKKNLQKQLDGMDALLADMKDLGVPVELPPAVED